MKFLPQHKPETPLERYTGVSKLENYIEYTKQDIADNLETLCCPTKPNLHQSHYAALIKLQQENHTLTIKPADKNLGIVVMDTDDYIAQCLSHLTDRTTYRPAATYPMAEIRREVANTITMFK